jgi:hypothetical protein
LRINTSGLSARGVFSRLPLPVHSAAPARFALPDPFRVAPARERTGPLGGAPLMAESLVATRTVARAVEKIRSDYPSRRPNGFFRGCGSTVSDLLSITPTLPVASLFSCRRRSIALLRLPARPPPRRTPAFVIAIALSRPRWPKPLFASLQQPAAHLRRRPGGWPSSRSSARSVESSSGHTESGSRKLMAWRDLTPLRRAAGSGSAQTREFLAHQPSAATRPSRFFRLASAVSRSA